MGDVAIGVVVSNIFFFFDGVEFLASCPTLLYLSLGHGLNSDLFFFWGGYYPKSMEEEEMNLCFPNKLSCFLKSQKEKGKQTSVYFVLILLGIDKIDEISITKFRYNQ